MKSYAWSYRHKLLFSWALFSTSIIAAIIWQQPLLAAIPFAWILFPVLYAFIAEKPEKLFWLVLVLLPLSTELQVTPSLGIDFPDEIILMLLTGIAILKLVHQPRWFPDALQNHFLFLVLVLYFFWLLITCLYSVEPLLSAKYVLAKIWYIIPFVVLPQVLFTSQSRIAKAAACLLAPMLFVVLQTLFRHSLYGFSFEKIQKTMAPFFRNHVNYSSMLVCLLPVGWCAWKLMPDYQPNKKWLLAALLIGLTGLLFAYSRGAWVALLAGISAIWVIRKKWMGAWVLLAVSGILLSTIWLVTDNRYMRFAPDHDKTVFHTDFSEHLQATVALKDVSNAERFYRWIAGARMLADKPVTGFGPNTFYPHYQSYTVKRFETWVSDNKEHSTVHNYFMLVAIEQGVIGLLLFCVLYFGMLLRIQKLYHQFQSRFYRHVSLTVGIVLVMIGVINSLSDMIETDKIGSLFWLCLGMVVLLDARCKEEREMLTGGILNR